MVASPLDLYRPSVERWLRSWDTPELAAQTTIEWSTRFTRSLGRCHLERGLIRLAAQLRDDSPELLEEVLCHELAHLAARKLHGLAIRPHGREWKGLMRAAGFEPRVRLAAPPSFRANARRRRKRLYLHACVRCRLTRTAGRAMRRWRCARCIDSGRDGRLTITRLDPGEGSSSTE